MNIKNYIYIALLGLSLSITTSCELADVTDVDPVYQVSEDKVITTLDQAQTVLHGTYGILIDGLNYTVYTPGLTALMGTTMEPGPWASSSMSAFYDNDVSPDNFYLESNYSKMYFLINNANHVIDKTSKLEGDETRKNEIIGEARFLRALSNFYLLRLWGEFYDESSSYGIVLKDAPISDATPQARATVSETYTSILSDLDFAIQHAPNFSNTFYVSNLAAKALKSKVLLYNKSYSEAAALALEVMNSNDRELEDTFAEVFIKKIENTNEAIFQTPFDDLNDRNNKAFMYRAYFLPSESYVATMENDARFTGAIAFSAGSPRNAKFNNSTYNGVPLTADTEYFLRLGEIYLIYAEAVLRGDDDIDKALDALNDIHVRDGNDALDIDNKVALLEAIRLEKVLELGAESGEEWFDLVRYYKEGDIDINTIKPLSSETRLILPIPIQSIRLSEDLIDQNPGY